MSTISASQNMTQPNQQDSSYDPSVTPIKRKRGRPRKDARPRKEEASGSEPNKRTKQCSALKSPYADDTLVGQEVSCSFNGVFDAGYLLTVQVGSSGPFLTGLVFDPRFCVPVSAENDIAPHLPMLRRNGFSPPVEEAFINQGVDSSQAGTAQKAGITQHIQAKESPTTSSFTSHVQTDLNMMEVTPSQNSRDAMEAQNIPITFKVFLEGAAAETSDQIPLTSSYHLQTKAKSEHAPISAGLSDVSVEAPASSKPSNGYNPLVLPTATFSEVFNPSSITDPSEVPETVTNASIELLNIPKEALFMTNEASLDVSNDDVLFDFFKPSDNSEESPFVILKPSEASAIPQKITLDEHKSSAVSAFEAAHVLQHQTLKIRDFSVASLSSELSSQRTEEPSEDPKVGDGRNTQEELLVLDSGLNDFW